MSLLSPITFGRWKIEGFKAGRARGLSRSALSSLPSLGLKGPGSVTRSSAEMEHTLMSLINKALGAKITISLGQKGARPDLISARIVSQPTVQSINGRLAEVASVITAAHTLDGVAYLGERLHNLAFAFDRSDSVEMLDGPASSPMSWQDLAKAKQAATLAYFATRPESVDVVSMDDIEAVSA